MEKIHFPVLFHYIFEQIQFLKVSIFVTQISICNSFYHLKFRVLAHLKWFVFTTESYGKCEEFHHDKISKSSKNQFFRKIDKEKQIL